MVNLSVMISLARGITTYKNGPCLRYPAPGYRDQSNGLLYYIGFSGYSWSSTPNGSSARYLNFRDNWLAPQDTNPRALGRQVRCLQE